MRQVILPFVAATLPSMAVFASDEIILSFSPEYAQEKVTELQAYEWLYSQGGYSWEIHRMWQPSDDFSSLVCNVKNDYQSKKAGYIEAYDIVDDEIYEVDVYIESLPEFPAYEDDNFCYAVVRDTNAKLYLQSEPLHVGLNTIPFPNSMKSLVYQIWFSPDYMSDSNGLIEVSKIVLKKTVQPILSWGVAEVEATLGDKNFHAPALKCEPEGRDDIMSEIYYMSSNKLVAEIDQNGVVKLNGIGTTTITAQYDGSIAAKWAVASYKLTVTENEVNGIVLDFDESTMAGSADDYASMWKVRIDDYSWTVKNFSNGNKAWDYIECAPNTGVASVTTDFSMSDPINDIVVDAAPMSPDYASAIYVETFGESNTQLPVDVVKAVVIDGMIHFQTVSQPGMKYRLSVDTSVLNGENLKINKITYLSDDDYIEPTTVKLLISQSDRKDAVFTEHSGNVYPSDGNWVIIKFDAPDGFTVWHRYTNGTEIMIPDIQSHLRVAQSTPDAGSRQGFTQYSGYAFKHIDNGNLEFFAESPAGVRTPVRTVSFSGVTAVNDMIVDEDGQSIYYNLHGMRIESPTESGIYLRRQGTRTERVYICR